MTWPKSLAQSFSGLAGTLSAILNIVRTGCPDNGTAKILSGKFVTAIGSYAVQRESGRIFLPASKAFEPNCYCPRAFVRTKHEYGQTKINRPKKLFEFLGQTMSSHYQGVM
jgi:hypothetical protein